MARKTESKHIGRYTYRVTQLGATEGVRLLATITRVLGPSLPSFAGDGPSAMVEGLKALTERLDAPTLEGVISTLAPTTRVVVQGKEPLLSSIYEEHFVGEYAELLGWLAFAIGVNYADFFRGLGPTLSGMVDQGSESPST